MYVWRMDTTTGDSGLVRFHLVRHGRTLWNEEQRIQGWSDSSLSRQGEALIRSWAPAMPSFGFDAVICSDLGRTVQTATILNGSLKLPVKKDDRLRERCFGNLEGRLIDEVRTGGDIDPDLAARAGAESVDQVRSRAWYALREYAAGPWRNVLAVVHYGVLHALLKPLAGSGHPLVHGQLIKSKRMHVLGMKQGLAGIVELNVRIARQHND